MLYWRSNTFHPYTDGKETPSIHGAGGLSEAFCSVCFERAMLLWCDEEDETLGGSWWDGWEGCSKTDQGEVYWWGKVRKGVCEG